MSPADTRADVKEELRAAEDALKAAESLLQLNLLRDAASRMYYAAFHAARALLFAAGVRPSSHQALRSLFARHFVKSGTFSADYSKLLGNLESERMGADYDTAFALGAEQIRPDLDGARELVAAARKWLGDEGWLT